jgi:hypothetical protein
MKVGLHLVVLMYPGGLIHGHPKAEDGKTDLHNSIIGQNG